MPVLLRVGWVHCVAVVLRIGGLYCGGGDVTLWSSIGK